MQLAAVHASRPGLPVAAAMAAVGGESGAGYSGGVFDESPRAKSFSTNATTASSLSPVRGPRALSGPVDQHGGAQQPREEQLFVRFECAHEPWPDSWLSSIDDEDEVNSGVVEEVNVTAGKVSAAAPRRNLSIRCYAIDARHGLSRALTADPPPSFVNSDGGGDIGGDASGPRTFLRVIATTAPTVASYRRIDGVQEVGGSGRFLNVGRRISYSTIVASVCRLALPQR